MQPVAEYTPSHLLQVSNRPFTFSVPPTQVAVSARPEQGRSPASRITPSCPSTTTTSPIARSSRERRCAVARLNGSQRALPLSFCCADAPAAPFGRPAPPSAAEHAPDGSPASQAILPCYPHHHRAVLLSADATFVAVARHLRGNRGHRGYRTPAPAAYPRAPHRHHRPPLRHHHSRGSDTRGGYWPRHPISLPTI